MRPLNVFVVMFALVAPTSASMQVINGLSPTLIPDTNNFKNAASTTDDLAGWGLDSIFNGGADVKITANGKIDFYYHAAESGFTNEFVVGATGFSSNTLIGGTALYQELVPGTPSGTTQIAFQQPAGIHIGSINVLNNDTFSALGIGFRVANKNGSSDPSIDALAGMAGFGIFFKDLDSGSGFLAASSFTTLFFGFDDNGAGPDDNHDDMIVRAVFTPFTPPGGDPVVPEATSLAIWSVLLGVSFWRASSRRCGRN